MSFIVMAGFVTLSSANGEIFMQLTTEHPAKTCKRATDSSAAGRPAIISNPILPGFNPDPSIVRVGDDYYIATSTFEWFPGVQIHHSRDLVNWRLMTRPLNRTELLDMKGVPNSGGVWAPCLSYSDGLFWLCYTVVHELNSATKDSPNYLTTASSIEGPWSDPVYLNSSGFDPSLFHDEDGRKWLLNMVWDHRPGRNPFHGIDLQEYDPVAQKLVGTPKNIFKGTELGCTEGPHLYRRNGWYYLMTAEGGTGFEHAVTLARSKTIDGPYEIHPGNPVLTSWNKDHAVLQKAGHGDLVETQNGEWYMVHLCSRPLPDSGRCTLGRETAIQRVEWRDDGWLYLSSGGHEPAVEVPAPVLNEASVESVPARDDFDGEELGMQYQTLRIPLDETKASLTERPGFLRLMGGESLESKFAPTLVARRQQAFRCRAVTLLEFEPETFQQMAGLVCYYNTGLYHYCCMSADEVHGTCLYIQSMNDGKAEYPLGDAVVPLNGATRVFLQVEIDHGKLRFSYSPDRTEWHPIGPKLDASILSDDYGDDWGFTGTFIGLACQDLSGRRKPADFDFFEYVEEE
jgi:xylan 1,4-beta-xylosidase